MKLISIAMTHAPLQNANLHRHKNWEIILNLEGNGINCIDGINSRFTAGTISLCPPGVDHAKKAESGLFKDIFAEFDDEGSLHRLARHEYQDMENGLCRQMLLMMHHIYHTRGRDGRNTVNLLLESVCNLLLLWDADRKLNPITEKLKFLIVENFADPEFKLAGAMDQLDVVKDHARRCFKKDLGMTPGEYLTQLRLNHAKKLLAAGGLLIQEIAQRSGYYDALYFSKLFKTQTGRSPSQYRID
jgi:AraC-like DNA-binding protein